MAAEEEWYFEEEGCLQFSGRPTSITFSPTSNCFICTLEDGSIEVVDVRSGLRLKRTTPAGSSGPLQCRFCQEVDKLFITNGVASGLRKDLNGVLLLDSILQPQIRVSDQAQLVLELSLPDALQLLSALEICIPMEEVVLKPMQKLHSQLKVEVEKAKLLINSTHDKAAKWYTCQLKELNTTFRVALNRLVGKLQKNNTALPAVAAMLARIINATGKVDDKKATPVEKIDMSIEALRRNTFLSWPHKEYRWAYPEAMAKAGFYHQARTPSSSGDDRALCFTCNVCLVCWEPTDEPWSEHERHSPDCPFVRGDYTENVPISVSLATGPALDHEAVQIKLISESSCSLYLATCSEEGHVIIWDIQEQLKIHSQFQVKFPVDVMASAECNQSSVSEAPTSFVAWEGSEDDIEGISGLETTDAHNSSDPAEEADENIDQANVFDEKCQGSQGDYKGSDYFSTTEEQASQDSADSVKVTALAIVCSCGKEATYTTDRKVRADHHTATLVLAVSIAQDSVGASVDGNSGQTKFGPHILVYDILCDVHNKSNGVLNEQNFSVVGGFEIDKEMLLQDPFSTSGSEDDWGYEPPHSLHSSVLQKFAEAIAGEDNNNKHKLNKPEKENVDPGKVVQCMQLSDIINAQCCKVAQIVPFGNGESLLLNIHFCESCRHKKKSPIKSQCHVDEVTGDSMSTQAESSSAQGNDQNVPNSSEHKYKDCIIVVYRIITSNEQRTLSQQPAGIRQYFTLEGLMTSIVVLPVESFELFADVSSAPPEEGNVRLSCPSQFLVAAAKYSVVVIDADSLNVLAEFTASNESSNQAQFVHVLNCPGVDCLCACTKDGNMHFLALRHQMADREKVDGLVLNTTDSSLETPAAGPCIQTDCLLDPKEAVTVKCLQSLMRLTEYVTLVPRFTASVPSSWVEMQEDQQHLNQQTLMQPVLHSRTWKLCTDNNSVQSKEQVVELLLPKYCQLGHIDVRFTLKSIKFQSSTNVYLLNSSCPISFKPGSRSTARCPAKNRILATAREQGSIICGPVSLKYGLDSTGRQGRITLTSPELIKTSSRVLLIVFENCGSREDLAEVSVTVARFKNNSPVEWRFPRSSLLDDSGLHGRLLDICVGSELVEGVTKSSEGRKLALELLCWICATSVNSIVGKNCLFKEVEAYLPRLIRSCYLQNGRSIAHRCSRLLMICGRQVIGDKTHLGGESSFRRTLLDAILDALPDTPYAVSSGAVHWLFKLLTGFAAQADPTSASSQCLKLLELFSSRLTATRFPEHLVLQARYGLYGCPFDPVLFDVRPKTTIAQQSSPNVVTSSLLPTSRTEPSPVSNDREVWSSVDSSVACQGLLEVQPLHFVCCSTSDGARVERGDAVQPPGTARVQMTGSVVPAGLAGQMPPSWPSSSSLAVLEKELQLLKQHQHQLVSLQQTKKQLQQQKKDLEDLSMWSLFPKLLSKVEVVSSGGVLLPPPLPPPGTFSSPTTGPGGSTLINLAQQKKLSSAPRKQERAATTSLSQPLEQHLMQLPSPQVLVIDRLHAGARHHVLLDFGCVVQLTDVLIPQCSDITSLSVDVFTHWEALDVERIAVVSDINLCAFVLKDLLPPPLCRYVKLTVVGRPKNNAKARVKIGEFFGHPLCGESGVSGVPQVSEVGGYDHHCLPILRNLLEDIYCHYNLSCTQLRALLQSCGPRNTKADLTTKGAALTEEEKKILRAYEECMSLQHQLNLVEQSINRLACTSVSRRGISCLDEAKCDHLQVICNCLVDTVVALMGAGPSSEGFLAKAIVTLEWQPWMREVTHLMCDTLFRNLCVYGSPKLRERVGALLLNSCGSKPWWGEFLANVLKEFSSSKQTLSFPQERMFVVLVGLSQCSPSIELVLTSFLRLLDEQLLLKDLKVDVPSVDLTLVGWLLLLLSHVLDTCIVQCKPFSSKIDPADDAKASVNDIGVASSSSKSKTYKAAKRGKTYKQSRWDFMLPMPVNQAAGSSSESTGYHPFSRHKMSKHSPSLPKKPVSDPPSHQSLLKSHVKQQLSYKMKGLVKIHHSHLEEDKPGIEERTSQSVILSPNICLPTSCTVPVMQKMMSFVLNMNSNCTVDLFLVACKVLAHLSFISEHCVCLSDVATHEQVEQLLRMCVMPMKGGFCHWGGAWTVHSLTSLLQDLLQGEKRSPMGETRKASVQTIVPEPQENGRESPVTTNMESKTVLMDAESGDSFDELYDVPPVDELPAPGWLVEFGETEYEFPSLVPPVQEKKVTARASSVEGKVGPPPVKLSSAIDVRLELGIEMEAEQDLKMLEHLQADAIAKVLSFSLSPSRNSTEALTKLPPRNGGNLRAEATLQSAFHKIFDDCDNPDVDVASLLHLWLTVQQCSPGLKLDMHSVNKLLLHLVCHPELSSQCQYLGFQVLTAVSEGQLKSSTQTEIEEIINSKDLLSFLVKSLSLPSAELCIYSPSTKPVKCFLFSLQSAVNGCNSAELTSVFQHMLLKALLELSSNRLANRAVTPQVEPITSVLLECRNELWCHGNLDVRVKLVDVSVKLSLDHLIHRPSVSLLPSAHPPPSPTPGMTQDKLDKSDWLVKLLFVVVQIVQRFTNSEPKNKCHQPPSSGASVGSFEQVSGQVQEAVENSSGYIPGDKRSVSGLADLLVQRKETFLRMLQCLNLCSADKASVLLSATSLPQDHNSPSEIQVNVKPTSVEDGIVRLLYVIHSQVSDCGMLVDGILEYLKRTLRDDMESSLVPQKHLSEPLLLLLLKLLDSSQAISQFYEKGGLAIVCQSIVSGQSFTLDQTPSGLIPVMQELACNKCEMGKVAAEANISEADWTKATINYAPYGSISCSSSPKHPPDALLKAMAPHRRARSATWSYRCALEESWCELVVSLPTAILLSDVHIQPHSAGLATCPSHVALDISNDKKVVVPVCGPVLTSGISVIKLKLQDPQIAQHIHIRCHRPRDSRVLGLSQIKIYGTSLYGSQNMVNQLLLKSKPQETSLGWVQLLSHCLTEGPNLTGTVNTPTLWPDVFSTCTILLLSPQSGIFSWCIETVLMKLSIQFPELGTLLIKQLLQGTHDEERTKGPVVSMTSAELIYQLGKHHDAVFLDRLAIMSSWLECVLACDSPSSVVIRCDHIQAVASVVWVAKDYVEEFTFREHFSEPLFRALFKLSQSASCKDDIKQSIDHLICALSHICPLYYDVLLELTGVKNILNHPGKKGTPTDSLSDFLSLAPQLATLASASQSPVTSQLLLNSGLLELLVESVAGGRFQFLFESRDQTLKASFDRTMTGSHHIMTHKGDGVSSNLLPQLLNFLTSCCQEPSIKDWMGEVAHQFWFPLLSVLSRSHDSDGTSLFGSSYERFSIETATVALLCKCIHCHPKNQEKMASLLCDVIEDQADCLRTDDQQSFMRISGFLRQLMLQMLLQEEKVLVCLHLEGNANWQIDNDSNSLYSSSWHPLFGAGHSFILLSVKCSSTLQELSNQILFPFADKKTVDSPPEDRNSKQTADVFTDPDDLYQYEGFEVLESVSLAAGLNVKSKRAEKSEPTAAKEGKVPPSDNQNQGGNLLCFFYHRLLGDAPLPHSLKLSQLLHSLMIKGIPSGTSCIELSCRTKKDNKQGDDTLLQLAPLSSPLDVFAKQNGLSQLSIHLPSHLIMPAAVTPSGSEEGRTVVEDSGSRWPCYPTRLPLPLVSLPASVLSTVPAHSLVAFGLFIQLPGYDKILLQDPLRARYLLRLLLGAKQDSDGASILSSPVATSLSTLPFQVLRVLFQNSAQASDKGVVVQRVAVEVGAIQLVLLCLAVLSHHQPQTVSHTHKLALQALSALTGSVYRDGEIGSANERNYWAKGTGFGTGSTSSGWDVEQAMLKQRAEEEHVTCLLQVLASYIGPFGRKSDHAGEPLTTMFSSTPPSPSDSLPASLLDLLYQSCLVPTLSSYLRNDSVLDMARHVPLYQAVLEVLRAISSCPVLLPLLLPQSKGDSHSRQGTLTTEAPSIASLLEKMKQCVDTYSRTLRSTQGKTEDTAPQNASGEPSSSGQGSQGQCIVEERKDPEAEGLALLIPDIQETAKLTQKVVEEFHQQQQQQASCGSDSMAERAGKETAAAQAAVMSHEEKYLATIRPLQFGTHRIVIENKDGKLDFDSGGYHFSSSLRSAATSGGSGGMVRARRLAQEVSSLATSLPLSSSSSVFVRCDKERLDVMKVLITGPSDTPYANGCFEFDVYFPHNYPESPMYINFETTGHHSIRFNPNLYNDGKVCLSILNTWHGRPEEKWNPQNSSFLQVLVSIQSLILVHEPYFNEPGYERSRGTPTGQQNSREYDANICQATVRWAMLEQLRKPSPCFKEVIQAHFYLKKEEIIEQCEKWIKDTEGLLSARPVGRAISHHVQSLKQNTALLKQELAQLAPPPEHKDSDSDEDSD